MTAEPARPIRIGVQLRPQHAGYAQIRQAAAAVEDAGVDALLPDTESYQRKSLVLDQHCARIGRDPAAIERSLLVAGPPELLGDQHLALGASLFIVGLDPTDDLAEVERWVAWRDRRNA